MDRLTYLVTAIITVFLCMVPGLIWWSIKEKNKHWYWEWTGVREIKFGFNKFPTKKLLLIVLTIIIMVIIFEINVTRDWHIEKYGRSSFFKTLYYTLINSFIMTAFAREILFRGSILSIFKRYTSYKNANIIQAIIYGFASFLTVSKWESPNYFLLFIVYFIIGYLFGLLREKSGDSILTSWAISGIFYFISLI